MDPGDQDAGTTKKTMKIEAKKGLGGARSGSRYGVEVASLLQRRITRFVLRSFTEKPRASNSIKQLLSRVN